MAVGTLQGRQRISGAPRQSRWRPRERPARPPLVLDLSATDLPTTIRPPCICCTVIIHLTTLMLTSSSLPQKRPRQESTPNSQSTSRNIEAGKAKGRRDHDHDRRVSQTGTLSLSVSSFWACNLYSRDEQSRFGSQAVLRSTACALQAQAVEGTGRNGESGTDHAGRPRWTRQSNIFDVFRLHGPRSFVDSAATS